MSTVIIIGSNDRVIVVVGRARGYTRIGWNIKIIIEGTLEAVSTIHNTSQTLTITWYADIRYKSADKLSIWTSWVACS